MNTLDHQMEADERINVSWSDPLQAALAIMMSAKSRHTKSDSMKHRHESAKFALLQSSSPSGVLTELRGSSLNELPTGLSSEDQEPIFPTDSFGYHAYWHAAFEVPYILWIYGVNSPHADRSLSEHAANGKTRLHTASMESMLAKESYSSSNQFYNGEK